MSDAMANNTATPRSARAAGMERRRALSQAGKSASPQAKVAAGAVIRKASATIPAPVAIAAPAPVMAQALSTGTSPAPGNSSTSSNGSKAGAVTGQSSGRDAARARREALCQQGRGDDAACRPTGRVRPKPAAPVKVETGTTLRGTGVTGTQVERSTKVTGNEPGSCRTITGTEYIGIEQYGALCAAVPEPAPAKVSVGSTSRGQRVSGTELGRSIKVTGAEHGTCKTVTGTEYLSADKFESFCATRPAPAPAKVNMARTAAGQGVSGTDVGRSAKVSGNETGSTLKLTGSQYTQPEPLGHSRRGASAAPHKVSVMSTVKNQAVTGTEIASGALVTGDEHGACTSVTGTEYKDLAQYQACNREPVPTPNKVGVMHTWHEQKVSGTPMERSAGVTGDEHGTCQPVSGTPYAGPDQYASFCEPDQQAQTRARKSASCGCMALTGLSQQSGNKVTGATRGKSQVLSGTAYSDTNNLVRQRADVAQAPHRLARGPADAPRAPAAPQVASVQGNFSVMTPARSAQDSSMNRITGTAYGAIGRITGPVNLAAGLVSGTPEFRYRDEVVSAAPVAMVQVPTVEAARNRLTGEGREGGFAITGAAWRRNESVTGTEGTSTLRNPTMRGGQRAVVIGASQNKERVRPEAAVSKITGSSGGDAKGSSITYSGGARG